jgi:hypothetical protein
MWASDGKHHDAAETCYVENDKERPNHPRGDRKGGGQWHRREEKEQFDLVVAGSVNISKHIEGKIGKYMTDEEKPSNKGGCHKKKETHR